MSTTWTYPDGETYTKWDDGSVTITDKNGDSTHFDKDGQMGTKKKGDKDWKWEKGNKGPEDGKAGRKEWIYKNGKLKVRHYKDGGFEKIDQTQMGKKDSTTYDPNGQRAGEVKKQELDKPEISKKHPTDGTDPKSPADPQPAPPKSEEPKPGGPGE